jgi:multiple sugar transport system permease protein
MRRGIPKNDLYQNAAEICQMDRKKETKTAYRFLAPTLITFAVFIAIPVCFSLLLSFTEWNFLSGLEGIKWVGFDNFVKMFSDNTFLHAIKNTFIYTLATVPISIAIALVLAYSLNGKVYFK